MNLRSRVRDAIYRGVEKTTSGRGVRRKVGGETLRFPIRWSRYYETSYEPGSFQFFREHCKHGDTVLDIGAHMGLFSVIAARNVGKTGRVFAFEPTPSTRQVLRHVVSINNLSHIIEVRGEAISGRSGKAIFHDTGDQISNANSLIQSERSQHGIAVRTLTIDDFVRERDICPQVIKIDVEGVEGDVLRGMAHTWKTARPAVLLGLHPTLLPTGQTLHDLWQMLQEYRMEVSLLNGGDESGPNALRPGQRIDEVWFCSRHHHFDVQLTPQPDASNSR